MVSHYRIVKKIGAGGMGEVYLAEDTKLDRKVAVKFLPSHLCQDDDCRARFKREAQAVAKLNHPNIIHVYEVSEYQSRPFFAMELVEGQSLRDLAKSKELGINRIIELAIQICDGLGAAHDKEVVHRDIKPSNIVIDAYGRPKILDFGLAAIQGGEHLTKTGSTLGTVRYMSPEQVQGLEVDQRSDLFSLGVVLYELISGWTPFEKDSEAATLKAITQDNPEPLARYKSDIPDELQRTVSKLLEKDPSLRYQHADGVASDLKRLVSHTQSSMAVTTRKKRSSWSLVIGGIVIIAVLVVAGIKYWPADYSAQPTSPTQGRKMLAVLPFENLGDPEGEYFADGITDEITSRLTKLSGLGVISRTSAIRYKNTDKGLPQIAEELGVGFILEGTIRWDKSGDTDRVRITPQLIDVSDNTHLWAENYGRDMSDIFAVQADIAVQIASALNVTLLQPEREALERRPTENLDAYHIYLQGHQRLWAPDYSADNYDIAVSALERATDLDSSFALAFAALAQAHSLMYHFGYDLTDERLAKAREAIDQALALQPDLPEVRFAYGEYYYLGRKDYEKALQEYTFAQKNLQDDSRVVSAIGAVYRRQGRFDEAISQFKEAQKLSPQDPLMAAELGWTLTFVRDYQAGGRYYNLSLTIAPEQQLVYTLRPWHYWVHDGDLQAARTTLEKAPKQDDTELLYIWYLQHLFERDYQGAINLLESSHLNIIELMDEFGPKTLLKAECYRLMKKRELANPLYDSAVALLEAKAAEMPDDHRFRVSLGNAYAGLGRKKEAIREVQLATRLVPVSKNFPVGVMLLQDLARMYVVVGEHEAALDEIDYLLSVPGVISVSLLKIDPRWDPLRDHPRFQALIEKYDKDHGI
jgi:serine/threonine protein kinase/tetratricopeptide (TPR) repeat protein